MMIVISVVANSIGIGIDCTIGVIVKARNRWLAAWNLLSEKGLGRNSSKPTEIAVVAVVSSSQALILIIASRLLRLPAAISPDSNSRNLLAASKPSITGICRSINTNERSFPDGFTSRWRAAAPFSAVSTRYPSFFSVMETIFRMDIESSTTRMLPFRSGFGGPEAADGEGDREVQGVYCDSAIGARPSEIFCAQSARESSGRYGILNQNRDPAAPSRRSLIPQSPLRDCTRFFNDTSPNPVPPVMR
mmetsp:Transcript_24570/g.33691  ORF Transcript_24570/g.33691 Transcript_24570/m.33691 type:complete len:247 (-) Transcript_24570:72-812(-)